MTDVEMMAMVNEFISFRDMKAEIEEKMEEMRAVMLADLNEKGVESIKIGGHKITSFETKRSTFDKKKFIEDFGEDGYKMYEKVSSSVSLRVS